MLGVYQDHSLWEGFPQYRLFDLLPISILLINLTTIPNQCNGKRFANVVGIAPFKPHLLAMPLENACEVVLMKVRRNKFSFKVIHMLKIHLVARTISFLFFFIFLNNQL